MTDLLYTAIIVAGGKGNRMNLKEAKQYMPLNGKSVFVYSVEHYIDACVDEIVLAVPSGDEEKVLEILENELDTKRKQNVNIKVVSGGSTRLHSVYNGLKSASGEYVLIHDAARPMTEIEDIKAVMEKVKEGACLLGHMAVDTIEVVKNGMIEKALNRDELFVAGTPQAFLKEEIKSAYDKMFENMCTEGFTDDVSVYRHFVKKNVYAVMESAPNLKITYKQDIEIANILLKKQEI
ncbi:MAG: 2-C-methyl-D-erythritol 4-phosphate cytidylyltransferase [Lachnospiraceae bacterium]|nr:2-C-methyl-D-erythritol 4-phosphate cytidylyltransferase [Lachnospiraceae bacterium]